MLVVLLVKEEDSVFSARFGLVHRNFGQRQRIRALFHSPSFCKCNTYAAAQFEVRAFSEKVGHESLLDTVCNVKGNIVAMRLAFQVFDNDQKLVRTTSCKIILRAE